MLYQESFISAINTKAPFCLKNTGPGYMVRWTSHCFCTAQKLPFSTPQHPTHLWGFIKAHGCPLTYLFRKHCYCLNVNRTQDQLTVGMEQQKGFQRRLLGKGSLHSGRVPVSYCQHCSQNKQMFVLQHGKGGSHSTLARYENKLSHIRAFDTHDLLGWQGARLGSA